MMPHLAALGLAPRAGIVKVGTIGVVFNDEPYLRPASPGIEN